MIKEKILCMFAVALIIILIIIGFTACNFQSYGFLDTNYHFEKAIIKTPDGEAITVNIKEWAVAGGDLITITTKDGKRYLVHTINCILIEENI